MFVEALDDGEVELGLILGQLGQYLRIEFEQNHFEVKY